MNESTVATMTRASTEIAEKKQFLRQKLRFRREHCVATLDAMATLAAFRTLPGPLADILDGQQCVGGYAAWRDEPDIFPLLSLIGQSSALALPRHVQRDTAMAFHAWQVDDALETGPWGPLQPLVQSPEAQPTLLLCPMLGFDRRGGRLGYGAGHYDRYFADHPAIPRVGIAWAVQEVDKIPVDPWDQPLDAILTEQEFIVTGDRL